MIPKGVRRAGATGVIPKRVMEKWSCGSSIAPILRLSNTPNIPGSAIFQGSGVLSYLVNPWSPCKPCFKESDAFMRLGAY